MQLGADARCGSYAGTLRTCPMPHNNDARRSIARLALMPSNDDTLRSAFAAIGEPCDRQPDIFPAARHGVRSPWRVIGRYLADAFDACDTPEQRREVVERIIAFFQEGIAYVTRWLVVGSPLDQRDVFETAQHADGDEDVAECLYLLNPCRTNRDRLIDAGRLDRQRSELRERHLLGATDPRGAA